MDEPTGVDWNRIVRAAESEPLLDDWDYGCNAGDDYGLEEGEGD